MKCIKKKNAIVLMAFALLAFSLTGCLTAKKLDKFVANQYDNELPKLNKKKVDGIAITPASFNDINISKTVHKTDKFLPLIVYWKYDHRQLCSLNTSIPVTNFSNAVNKMAPKMLVEKLNGRSIELTVEQAPEAFSIVSKENLVWVIYAFSWSKIYIEPDTKDLIVSYKLLEENKALKTGTITVKNTERNQGIRMFQSWKSATSEYLSDYNSNFTNMTKEFMNQLIEEI